MAKLVLVLDSGTTNSKVALVNANLEIVWSKSIANTKECPRPTWVEQDPQQLFDSSLTLLKEALAAGLGEVSCMGITSQRETTIVWDKKTGQPLYPAIVWEDARTTKHCLALAKDRELSEYIRQQTGLMPLPYFSATKLQWLIKHLRLWVNDFGRVCFGTVDSWLVYKLTGNHYTDYTNASRTLLFNIRRLAWDEYLLQKFGIPPSILPTVQPSQANYGITANSVVGTKLPLNAVVGDQQASLYAAGSAPGTVKVTYGTGIFPMRLLGPNFELKEDYLTTLAVSAKDHPIYAWESKVENAAARTTPALNDPIKLTKIVKTLARQTSTILKPLLDGVDSVTVDGGISQNNTLLAEQAKLSGIKTRRLMSHEGTIEGVAKLLFNKI